MRIQVVNRGSSSLKAALYGIDKVEPLHVAIEARRVGIPGGQIQEV